MKIISWNLNGLNSCIKQGSFESILAMRPNIICCQETRTKQQMEVLPGYTHYWNPAKREGYSGTMAMARQAPRRVLLGLGDDRLDAEGRVLTLEYPAFFVVNAYAPNSQSSLKRHEFRMEWNTAFKVYLQSLLSEKPLIACGDFNATLSSLDIYSENGRQYWVQQGYATDERTGLEELLDIGLVDAFRELHPRQRSYTWWSNRLRKREQDRGWRLDYFFISENLLSKVIEVRHHQDILGSDHCPIELEVRL